MLIYLPVYIKSIVVIGKRCEIECENNSSYEQLSLDLNCVSFDKFLSHHLNLLYYLLISTFYL